MNVDFFACKFIDIKLNFLILLEHATERHDEVVDVASVNKNHIFHIIQLSANIDSLFSDSW